MNRRVAIQWTCRIAAVLLAIGALFCFSWALSSSSLAFVPCDGRFELSSTDMRCRQPVWAEVFAGGCLLVAFALAVVSTRVGSRPRA